MQSDHTLEISLLRRLKEKDCELKATMSYIVRPCLKIKSEKCLAYSQLSTLYDARVSELGFIAGKRYHDHGNS